MTTRYIFLIESFLFEGSALAFGIWQLWTVWPRKKDKADEPSALARSSEEDTRHAEGQHRADDG
jgi:hypothetical protein